MCDFIALDVIYVFNLHTLNVLTLSDGICLTNSVARLIFRLLNHHPKHFLNT